MLCTYGHIRRGPATTFVLLALAFRRCVRLSREEEHFADCTTLRHSDPASLNMTLGLFFTALGYLTGIVVLILAARERKLLTEGMLRVGAAAFVGGVVGAKVTEWAFSGWPFKISPWLILDPSLGGKSLLGGVLIGWVCAEVAKRRMGIKRST